MDSEKVPLLFIHNMDNSTLNAIYIIGAFFLGAIGAGFVVFLYNLAKYAYYDTLGKMSIEGQEKSTIEQTVIGKRTKIQSVIQSPSISLAERHLVSLVNDNNDNKLYDSNFNTRLQIGLPSYFASSVSFPSRSPNASGHCQLNDLTRSSSGSDYFNADSYKENYKPMSSWTQRTYRDCNNSDNTFGRNKSGFPEHDEYYELQNLRAIVQNLNHDGKSWNSDTFSQPFVVGLPKLKESQNDSSIIAFAMPGFETSDSRINATNESSAKMYLGLPRRNNNDILFPTRSESAAYALTLCRQRNNELWNDIDERFSVNDYPNLKNSSYTSSRRSFP